MSALHCGILVGGKGSRMGGAAKGMLRAAPDGPRLVERLQTQLACACPGAAVVLVGQRPEYAELGVRTIDDAVKGIGPLGGLKALLLDAKVQGADYALVVACDLPFVSAGLLRRLSEESASALALAPKQDGRWQPLCARYAVSEGLVVIDELLARGELAMFRVLEALSAVELTLDATERAELLDWDEPTDVARDRGNG